MSSVLCPHRSFLRDRCKEAIIRIECCKLNQLYAEQFYFWGLQPTCWPVSKRTVSSYESKSINIILSTDIKSGRLLILSFVWILWSWLMAALTLGVNVIESRLSKHLLLWKIREKITWETFTLWRPDTPIFAWLETQNYMESDLEAAQEKGSVCTSKMWSSGWAIVELRLIIWRVWLQTERDEEKLHTRVVNRGDR